MKKNSFWKSWRLPRAKVALFAVWLGGATSPASPEQITTGREVSGRLFAALMTTLQQKIAEEGPAAAIAYCRLEALPITSKIAHEFPEVKNVRRTALRVRNPANAPDETDRAVLEAWQKDWQPGQPPSPEIKEVVSSGGQPEVRYYQPVPVMATCLTCHGPADTIAPAVRTAIRAAYPEDQATDFAEGDLRGAIVVTFDAK
jgi:hypothetical protein